MATAEDRRTMIMALAGSNGHIIRSTTLYSFRYNSIDWSILSDVLRPSYLGILVLISKKKTLVILIHAGLPLGQGFY